MASTWFFAFMNANWPAPALASGFVICVWVIMFLGWFNTRFTPVSVPGEPEAGMESQSAAAVPPQRVNDDAPAPLSSRHARRGETE
jgi:hypothetical protein